MITLDRLKEIVDSEVNLIVYSCSGLFYGAAFILAMIGFFLLFTPLFIVSIILWALAYWIVEFTSEHDKA